MRDFFSSIPLWTYALLVVVLCPLAAYLGWLWGWTPGAASLAVLLLPLSAAALSGNCVTAMTVSAFSAAGCFGEALYAASTTETAVSFGFPLFAAGGCFALAGTVTAVVEHLLRDVDRLEENNARYVRDLYRLERQSDDNSTADPANQTTSKATSTAADDDMGNVDYAMMLLTLQDVGRRISTNLDVDTLIPTILSTAKASLKCGQCRVYLWNGRESTLRNPLAKRGRDASGYSPRPKVGMTHWVLENRQILTRKSVEEDYALNSLLEEDPDMPEAIAPLAVGGELLGILVVDDFETVSPNFVRLLYILANIYALGIKNAQLFQRIEEMARRDGLTGLLNHASFQEELQRSIGETEGSSAPLSVVMADIDHFKQFNDTYAHQAGDHVLREVAALWKAVLPDHAIIARYGGEEFICALPGDDISRGVEIAELLRNSIESRVLQFDGQELRVKSSFGVAQFGQPADNGEELIRIADEAMYVAKESGRNRVVAGPPVAGGVS